MDASQMLKIYRDEASANDVNSAASKLASMILQDIKTRLLAESSRRTRRVTLYKIIEDLNTEWRIFAPHVTETHIPVDGLRKLIDKGWVEQIKDNTVKLAFQEALRQLPPLEEESVVAE